MDWCCRALREHIFWGGDTHSQIAYPNESLLTMWKNWTNFIWWKSRLRRNRFEIYKPITDSGWPVFVCTKIYVFVYNSVHGWMKKKRKRRVSIPTSFTLNKQIYTFYTFALWNSFALSLTHILNIFSLFDVWNLTPEIRSQWSTCQTETVSSQQIWI